ncbi:MAG: hypothetical protein L6437_08160 [Kiritimatiellae bacterium]|nr:hypothetical protein [Kiritimatiellia bacterium]
MVFLEVRQPDGTIRAGIAGDDYFIRQNPHFHGFADVITAMVNGINEGLLYGRKRVIEKAFGFDGLAVQYRFNVDGQMHIVL